MQNIIFPGLWNFKISINAIAFKVFNINVYWYGIIIALAFTIAIFWASKDSKRFNLDANIIIDLAIIITPFAVIFARLYYVIFSWDEFKYQPLKIFNTRTGGLAIYGGIIGGILAIFLFAKIKKIPLFNLLDFLVPYLAFGQSLGRWGNFVNQEAFGTNTLLPWGMTSDTIKDSLIMLRLDGINVSPDIPVHPTFLYESLWDLIIMFILFTFRKRKAFNGQVFFMYLILYGFGRFWIENLRLDSLYLASFRISQVLSLVIFIVFSLLFLTKYRKSKMKNTGITTDII